MEASASTVTRGLRNQPNALGRLGRGFRDPVRNTLQEIGEIARFSFTAFAELRGVWRYGSEILRQASILIIGSAAVLFALDAALGGICGIESGYVLGTYGAAAYSGIYTSYCAVRGSLIGFMFGYAISAKVGTGLAAEVGVMRISKELDAMEAQGIDPMRYVVATRLAAGFIVFPFIATIGAGILFLIEGLANTRIIYATSEGQWASVHFQFIGTVELLYVLIWVMIEGTVIMLVGMYYGYKATGGPVGVGTATARSMVFNIVFVHLLGVVLVLALFGIGPKVVIGG